MFARLMCAVPPLLVVLVALVLSAPLAKAQGDTWPLKVGYNDAALTWYNNTWQRGQITVTVSPGSAADGTYYVAGAPGNVLGGTNKFSNDFAVQNGTFVSIGGNGENTFVLNYADPHSPPINTGGALPVSVVVKRTSDNVTVAGPFTLGSFIRQNVHGDAGGSPGLANYPVSMTLSGVQSQCPPRDLTFVLDGLIAGSGKYDIKLKAHNQLVAQWSGEYLGAGGPPLEFQKQVQYTTPGGEDTNWQLLVNGQAAAVGVVTCDEELQNDEVWIPFEAIIQPEPKPEPNPEDKPDPDKEQPPSPNANPNPEGNKPGEKAPTTGTGSGVALNDPTKTQMTKADYYEAVFRALNDAGNTGTVPGAPLTSGFPSYGSEGDKTGRLGDIEGKLKDIAQKAGENSAGLQGLVSWDTEFVPQDIGREGTWTFATIPIGSRSYTIQIELARFQQSFEWIRQIFLLFVYMWFVWACATEIKEAF